MAIQHLSVLLLCCLYGSVFSISKLCLYQAPPLFITAARMLLAGLLLLGFQAYKAPHCLRIQRSQYFPLCLVGLCGVYLTNALEFWGLQFMEAGKSCFIYSFTPIATALLSYWWFNERITFKKWIGLCVGIAGFIPVLLAQNGIEDLSPKLGPFSYAEIATLLAAVATAIGWITMRSMVKQQALPAVVGNAYSMLIGGMIALVHSLISEPWNPTPVSGWWPFTGYFLALLLISNLIAYNLHAHLLKTFTATYISFAGLSQTFFAALFGWLFLGEVMQLEFWMSLLCVIIGIYLYSQTELKQGILLQKHRD